ncbi:hypothetical protein EVAR_39894_1 [Eumeta japonica]|uniref:Uncharacterized protein n=1 Tax=Eumeta variegata TaxID=151549 RepID=A0A4C1WQP1_EUMVA|nr:hypothetical protein EVAR_39894_1 [Eumeta japonica]
MNSPRRTRVYSRKRVLGHDIHVTTETFNIAITILAFYLSPKDLQRLAYSTGSAQAQVAVVAGLWVILDHCLQKFACETMIWREVQHENGRFDRPDKFTLSQKTGVM